MKLSNIIFCLATAVVVTAQSDDAAAAHTEELGECRGKIWEAECPGDDCMEWTSKVGDQCDDPGRRFLRGRGLAFGVHEDTVSPTKEPTVSPSVSPTKYPTAAPTAPTVAPTKGVADCIGLDKINWDVLDTSGLVGTGGWKISDLGRTIRFDVEPDEECGGANGNTQTGEAKATITGLPAGTQLAYTLQGQGERVASGYDELRFLIRVERKHLPNVYFSLREASKHLPSRPKHLQPAPTVTRARPGGGPLPHSPGAPRPGQPLATYLGPRAARYAGISPVLSRFNPLLPNHKTRTNFFFFKLRPREPSPEYLFSLLAPDR